MNAPESTAAGTVWPISSPLGGAHPSWNQKTYSISWPSQNTGIETPTIASSIVRRLAVERRLMPASTPSGMPISSQIAAAPTARVAVTGRRRAISSFTGTKLP